MSDNIYFRVNECVFYYSKHKEAVNNERAVEIPLGEFFINNFGFGITDIDGVMSSFDFPCGEVISASECLKKDLSNKNILALGITTNAIELLNKTLKESNNFLLTWAIGHYKELDLFAKNNNIPKFTMKRVSESNLWVKDSVPIFELKYNDPFPYANGICCVTNLETLL